MAINKKGFTLIELTVSMGVLALIVGLTAGILITVVKSYQRQRISSEVERNGDFIMRSIEESFRSAHGISCMDNSLNIVTPGDGICHLGDGTGRVLFIESTSVNKYFGRGRGTSSICDGTTNCYGFVLTDPSKLTASGTITDTSAKLTNDDVTNGVNVTKFDVAISGGGASGAPFNIAVTIDVSGPKGSIWETETARTFQSFLTLRGSY